MSGRVRAARPRLGAAAGPALLGAMLGSLVAGRPETALICLGASLLIAIAVGASWPSRAWTLTLAVGLALGGALNLYLTPGRPLGGWPVLLGRAPTEEGAAMGWLLALRMLGAYAALQGLRAAWTGEQAADAAARALAPLERLRVPVREARAMLGLALRFAPLLRTEARRLARVQDLRAGRAPRGAREWLQRRRAATVPLMVGSLERAERVALALEARHYRLRGPRALAGAPAGAGAPEHRAAVWAGAGAGLALAAAAIVWRT
jgi:energy-coupling factor transporter transmembrane protein EcfT